MKLNGTVEMMNSKDYKERFKGEYLQLKIRMEGLSNMLKKYKDSTLTFTPSCSYDLLNGQLKAMGLYSSYLEERAKIENIKLQASTNIRFGYKPKIQPPGTFNVLTSSHKQNPCTPVLLAGDT